MSFSFSADLGASLSSGRAGVDRLRHAVLDVFGGGAVCSRDATGARPSALTLFYFLAFGGFVAMFLYLPKPLVGVYQLDRADAGYRAAGFAFLAVLARPVGGWLADRIGAERVLLVSFAGTSALAAILTGFYAQMVPLTIASLSLAVCLGLGTGVVFKMVGNEFPQQVGAVTGVVGAARGLADSFHRS